MKKYNYVGMNTHSVISLESIGIITGIILCILEGTGVIDIGWFWATFPFWIPIALDIVLFAIIMLIAFIIALNDN